MRSMLRRFKALPGIVLVALTLTLAAPISAGVKFTRVDEDDYMVFHKKSTMMGGTKKTIDTLYREIGSPCVAAGFQYFEQKQLNVTERQFWKSQQAGSNAEV